jgi:hypothetical protein
MQAFVQQQHAVVVLHLAVQREDWMSGSSRQKSAAQRTGHVRQLANWSVHEHFHAPVVLAPLCHPHTGRGDSMFDDTLNLCNGLYNITPAL